MYSQEGKEGVPATFQILNFIAWKPDPSQKGPAKRGSAQFSLKDLDKVNAAMQNEHSDDPEIQRLQKEIERMTKNMKDSVDNGEGSNKDS